MNRDKKNVILVCKEFAIVGTPVLYRHMALSIEALTEGFASLLSRPENYRGLADIRTLRIGGGTNGAEFFHPSGCDFSALCRLLSAIPENALEQFRYVST
jgi:hypothetical protein